MTPARNDADAKGMRRGRGTAGRGVSVSWEGFALFLHFVAVVAGFMISGTLHAGLFLTRSGGTVAELRPWARVIPRLEPFLGLVTLGIFGTGAWLIVLEGEWISWTDGWVIWSIVALVLVQTTGIALGPREKVLFAAIEEAPLDGPVTDAMRPDSVLFVISHVSTALVLGILYLMVFKPSGLGSVLTLVVAAALGVVSAVPFLRPRVAAEGPVSAPTTT